MIRSCYLGIGILLCFFAYQELKMLSWQDLLIPMAETNDISFHFYVGKPVFYMMAIVVACFWAFSLYYRIYVRPMQEYMYTMALLLISWLMTRHFKLLSHDEEVIRWLWYCYYIAIIWIPVLWYQMCYYYNYRHELPRQFRWGLYGVATCLLALVLSNDYHQWMFSFPDGLEKGIVSYNREWLYRLVFIYSVGLFGKSIYDLIHIRFDKERLRHLAVLMGIFSALMLFSLCYNYEWLGMHRLELTMVFCLAFFLILEYVAQNGFADFNLLSLPFSHEKQLIYVLYNESGQITYVSPGAELYTLSLSKVDPRQQSLRVSKVAIRLAEREYQGQIYRTVFGYALILMEVTELLAHRKRLQETQRWLQQQRRILRGQKQMKRKRQLMAIRMALMTSFVKTLQPYIEMFKERLLLLLRTTYAVDLPQISDEVHLLSRYISRYASFISRSQNEEGIAVPDFQPVLEELYQLRHHYAIDYFITCQKGGEILPLTIALSVYEYNFQFLFRTLPYRGLSLYGTLLKQADAYIWQIVLDFSETSGSILAAVLADIEFQFSQKTVHCQCSQRRDEETLLLQLYMKESVAE